MVSSSLTFYTHPQSRGRIVRWMLEEVGEPYDTVLLDYGSTMKAPSYRAVNPMGKVPAIRHGDTVVTETAGNMMMARIPGEFERRTWCCSACRAPAKLR